MKGWRYNCYGSFLLGFQMSLDYVEFRSRRSWLKTPVNGLHSISADIKPEKYVDVIFFDLAFTNQEPLYYQDIIILQFCIKTVSCVAEKLDVRVGRLI